MLHRIEALRAALGDAVPAGELADLATAVDEWQAQTGEALVAEGHQAPQGFVVVEGAATVWVGGEPVARLGPGSLVLGDAGRPSPASVVADCPMWVLVLAPTELGALRRHLAGSSPPPTPTRNSRVPPAR